MTSGVDGTTATRFLVLGCFVMVRGETGGLAKGVPPRADAFGLIFTAAGTSLGGSAAFRARGVPRVAIFQSADLSNRVLGGELDVNVMELN